MRLLVGGYVRQEFMVWIFEISFWMGQMSLFMIRIKQIIRLKEEIEPQIDKNAFLEIAIYICISLPYIICSACLWRLWHDGKLYAHM